MISETIEPAEPVALRPLGNTGILASPITLGTSGLGRDTSPGHADEADAVALASAVLHGPFALIDTANEYARGRSEAVLGTALATHGIAPGRSIVTKVDRDLETGVFDRDRVLRSFEESCARLGVERIGLVHLHDPYVVSFDEAMGTDGAVQGLLDLREQGLVDAIGIAAGHIGLTRRYVETGLFDAMLTHNRFTLVDDSARSLMIDARKWGMGVFNAAPFGGGLLARGSASGARYAYTESPSALLDWVRKAEAVCERHGVELPTAALHFSLRSPLVDSTVVGVSNPARIQALAEALTLTLPDELWHDLTALGAAPTTIDDGAARR